MGLSSLLSKDEELASVIKSKIKAVSKNEKIKSKTISDGIASINENQLATGVPPLTLKGLSIQYLVSGKFQPRKNFDQTELEELAESIKSNGVLQPILVRPLSNSGKSFEIIAGERRWRASQIARLHEVPVIKKFQ